MKQRWESIYKDREGIGEGSRECGGWVTISEVDHCNMYMSIFVTHDTCIYRILSYDTVILVFDFSIKYN
jgi:hypothetical protein